MRFEVRHERTGSVPLVAIAGEIDIATVDLARSSLRGIAADQPVVIDLSETSFIDGSGVRMLFEEHERRSAALHIVCAPNGPLPRILEISRVHHQLRLYGDRESAIWAARSQHG